MRENQFEDKGITRRVWLLMLNEGGRWSAAELAEPANRASTEMANLLKSMHKSGHVARYEPIGKDGRVKFGITIDCKAPVGVTLKDLADAGAVRVSESPQAVWARCSSDVMVPPRGEERARMREEGE